MKLNLRMISMLAIAIPAILCFREVCSAASAYYAVVDLGSLPGGSSIARYMNEQGQVVGTSGIVGSNDQHAFLWSSELGIHDLGALPAAAYNYSAAFAINAAGDVIGESNTAESIHAVLWKHNGGIRDLGALPGDNGSRAFGINNAGEVVGYSSGPAGVRAFIWFETSGMQSLGTLPGGDYSEALAINNAQQVVGISTSASGKHAFFWSKADGMIDLGVLSGDEASRAVRINDAGLVVGASHSAAGKVHAFLWSKTGRMRHLASLETGDYAEALDINKRGDVVGASGTSRGARASIWKDAGVQDLNGAIAADLNIVLSMALRINDHGQIVCLGVIHRDLPADSYDLDDEHHAGALHAFLLTPTQ